MQYPELYVSSDKRALRAQFVHYTLIRAEHGLLILTAIVAWCAEYLPIHSGVFGLSFVALVAVATLSHFQKADSHWYQARSIAESVKSTTWLFVMRARPFDDALDNMKANRTFLENLMEIFAESESGAFESVESDAAGVQLTDAMLELRSRDLEARKTHYLQERMQDQRRWYAGRARFNSARERVWYVVACAIYSIPLALIVFQVIDASSEWALVSIFLLLGSGLLGWTKSRRYRELSVSYAITARELDFLAENVGAIDTEAALSEFVVSSEAILSREHRQWFARQMIKRR